VVKEIIETVEPRTWAFVRLSGATLLVIPLVIWQRHRWPARRLYLILILAGFLGVFLNQALFTEGLKLTTPEHSAIINTSIPVVTLLVAVAVRQERFRWSKLVAIVVSLTGVLALLRVDELLVGAAGEGLGDVWTGDLLTAANATSFSIFVVLMRHLARRDGDRELDPMGATVFCFVAGCVMMGGFAAPDLTAENLRVVANPGIWPLAIFSIVGATVVTYALNNWALKHVESSMVTLYIYVQPVIATCLSIAMGREVPGPRFFIAASLVCGGLFVESLAARRHRRRRLDVTG
jgi:drug/metabolite transporter (DMT)-like permease